MIDRKGNKQAESLGQKAVRAAEEHDAHRAVIERERAMERAILADVLQQVRVGTAAISSWIPLVKPVAGSVGTSYDRQGVRVAGTGPRELTPLRDEGVLVGKALYLLDDCTFIVVEYTGTWARRPATGGTDTGWTATATPQTLEEVIDAWELQEILHGIALAFDQQAGRRAKATTEAQARAERLAALARLV